MLSSKAVEQHMQDAWQALSFYMKMMMKMMIMMTVLITAAATDHEDGDDAEE